MPVVRFTSDKDLLVFPQIFGYTYFFVVTDTGTLVNGALLSGTGDNGIRRNLGSQPVGWNVHGTFAGASMRVNDISTAAVARGPSRIPGIIRRYFGDLALHLRVNLQLLF